MTIKAIYDNKCVSIWSFKILIYDKLSESLSEIFQFWTHLMKVIPEARRAH
jgi:hypothetical protein